MHSFNFPKAVHENRLGWGCDEPWHPKNPTRQRPSRQQPEMHERPCWTSHLKKNLVPRRTPTHSEIPYGEKSGGDTTQRWHRGASHQHQAALHAQRLTQNRSSTGQSPATAASRGNTGFVPYKSQHGKAQAPLTACARGPRPSAPCRRASRGRWCQGPNASRAPRRTCCSWWP